MGTFSFQIFAHKETNEIGMDSLPLSVIVIEGVNGSR